jgi:hypothetical protein
LYLYFFLFCLFRCSASDLSFLTAGLQHLYNEIDFPKFQGFAKIVGLLLALDQARFYIEELGCGFSQVGAGDQKKTPGLQHPDGGYQPQQSGTALPQAEESMR